MRIHSLERKLIRQTEQHVAAAGEGYGEHLRFATTVGLLAIAAGLAGPVGALLPALCTRSGKPTIARLRHRMAERCLLEHLAQQSSGAITVVGPVLSSAVVAPVVGGARFGVGVVVGAMAVAIPLAFRSTPERAGVHAG